jgi:quinol monooxygenase YgiN
VGCQIIPIYIQEGNDVICYLIKIGTKPYKNAEFTACVNSLSPKVLREKGCKAFNLYIDSEKDDTFAVVGEWNTREAMEVHFQKANYEILIGSSRVLCETMEMNISEVIETGGLQMAKKYIAEPKLAGSPSDKKGSISKKKVRREESGVKRKTTNN